MSWGSASGGALASSIVRPRLAFRQGLGDQHVDGRGLEAEVGIEVVGEAIEAQRDQAGDMRRIAARRGEAEVERSCDLSVHPEQQQPQARARRPHRARARGRAHRAAASPPPARAPRRDRLEKGRLRAIDGRRDDQASSGSGARPSAWSSRSRNSARSGRRRARAAGPSPGRCGGSRAGAAARASSPTAAARRAAAACSAFASSPEGTMLRILAAVAGHRPGCPGRIGNGERGQRDRRREPPVEIGQQPRLAAEQVRAARDVEEQAVGAARLVPGRGDRRIAQAPQRELAQARRHRRPDRHRASAGRAPWSARWRGDRPRSGRPAARRG